MSQTYKVGELVMSAEHPSSIGKVLRVNEDGDLTIEWTTPKSERLPYGHIGLEFWPVSDQMSLMPYETAQ